MSGTFRSGGMDRTYTLHVPPGDPVGLVLSLHGGGGSGTRQRGLTDFDGVADAHHLLVAYPDGYDKSWADGRGASPADRHHVDDVTFLVALAGKLQGCYNIDPGHVFVTGMSNGGFMSNRLAFYRVDKGGHTWPGGRQYLPRAVIGRTTRALDGSEAIAQFFLTHARG
jgi:polyhydroxybutyrate depolymerase